MPGPIRYQYIVSGDGKINTVRVVDDENFWVAIMDLAHSEDQRIRDKLLSVDKAQGNCIEEVAR